MTCSIANAKMRVIRVGQEKAPSPFRFLKPHEFAELKQEEKLTYLQQAIEAVRSGRTLEDSSPPRNQQH
jgi:hypothetical protein